MSEPDQSTWGHVAPAQGPPLGRLLQRINLVALASGMLVLAVVVIAGSFAVNLHNLKKSAQVQARILAENLAAPLAFQDIRAAHEVLNALRNQDEIRAVGLYTKSGGLFASYLHDRARQDGEWLPLQLDAPATDEVDFALAGMDVTQAVRVEDELAGTLYVRAHTTGLYLFMLWQAVITLLAAFLALIVAVIMLRPLRAQVLRPITGLIDLTNRISAESDYSGRAPAVGIAEMDALAGGFNEMLGEIQSRDARLAAHRDRLEEEVSLRTAELRAAADKAQAASRAKSAFLATMSHEIRTPMNGVLGMTELLLASELNDKQRHYAGAVLTSGQHLLGIINDILDFSKIESGRLELETVDFDLRTLLDETLLMFAQPAADKDLELVGEIEPKEGPLRVRGDPFRIRQVLGNLIGNAIKFTERGEVVVQARLGTRAGKPHLSVTVRDTGIGIRGDALEHIFEQFSQADESTTRRFGGTGLGLTICRHLLRVMGGDIRVESRVGEGSTFSFDVPLAAARQPAQESQTGRRLAESRILVVDDNRIDRDILVRQLLDWQVAVASAASGAEALVMLKQAAATGAAYDLILLDMHMPGVNGMELAESLRALADGGSPPLLLLGPADALPDAAVLARAGVAGCIHKPIRPAQLEGVLRGALAGNDSPAQRKSPAKPTDEANEELQGMRVLVVEDNHVNQLVAEAMLSGMGMSSTLAANGQEALDLLGQGDFDLILMDCQMPVMDGYAATAAIRQLPDGRGAGVPIVALTANAVHGDREKCLAAGMNDYLAKPFNLDQLRKVIQRWRPERTVEDPHRAAGADAAAAPAPGRQQGGDARQEAAATPTALDEQALAVLRQLDGDGRASVLRQVLQAFLDFAPKVMEQMGTAVAAGDGESLRRGAHSLKSGAANAAALGLSRACARLEVLGRDGRLQEAAPLLAEATQEYQRAVAEIRALLAAP